MEKKSAKNFFSRLTKKKVVGVVVVVVVVSVS